MKLKQIITLGCVSLLAALWLQTSAEVRVLTDRVGSYRMVRVTQDASGENVWTANDRGDAQWTLNEEGDRNGDLRPTIRENPVAPYYPWAVWSRIRDADYELAWSRWDDGGWSPIGWLAPEGTSGDNLDAELQFDDDGRPYVTWWRHDGEGGSVMLSLFMADGAWMAPFPVSEVGVDSRYPEFESVSAESVSIRYRTEAGLVEQIISFNFPVTITEDINPLDFVQTDSRSLVEE